MDTLQFKAINDESKPEILKLDPEEEYEKFIAYTFIQGSDHSITGKPEEDLSNQFSLCVNSYPYDLENAANMINNHKNYVDNPKYTENKNKQSKKYLEKESDDKL